MNLPACLIANQTKPFFQFQDVQNLTHKTSFCDQLLRHAYPAPSREITQLGNYRKAFRSAPAGWMDGWMDSREKFQHVKIILFQGVPIFPRRIINDAEYERRVCSLDVRSKAGTEMSDNKKSLICVQNRTDTSLDRWWFNFNRNYCMKKFFAINSLTWEQTRKIEENWLPTHQICSRGFFSSNR